MIVEKGYAECVLCISMVKLMAQAGRVTTCQLHMRMFKDGDTIHIEPFRAKAFPVIKDLSNVDRGAFDRVQHAGGFISVNTSGNTQDANSIPISKHAADEAMDAATCIGCGACVATCKNSSGNVICWRKSFAICIITSR